MNTLAMRLLLLVACMGGCVEGMAYAQAPPESDSLRTYNLDEIVVRSAVLPEVATNTVHRVALAALAQEDATSVDQVVRLIPGAHVQTNSRGETLVYLRNAGERQVALFFDGALLNVPWDNRYDLSFIPAGVIGAMTVEKGVPSVLYGTNVLGGAINLVSRRLSHPGHFVEVVGTVGVPAAAQLRLTSLRRSARMSHALSVGYDTREGIPLPRNAHLPFSQPDPDVRTNTDERTVHLFGQATYQASKELELGLMWLRLDGEKGVAPEGHVDPEVANVRYWRYPAWQTSMLILNGQHVGSAGRTLVRGAVWGTHFGQTIDQFRTVAYDRLQETQEDDDQTLGTRLTLVQKVRAGDLRVALNALTTRHRQRNQPFDENGLPTPPVDSRQTYRQHIGSLGAEYEWQPTARLGVLLGGSLDGIATPATGDKPPRDPQLAFGVTAGWLYRLNDAWTLRASAGRKVRFPTMRELFGEALGRFLVNLDLKPEATLLTEAGVVVQGTAFSGEAMGFLNRTFDTIDQQSVQLPGESRPRRQRINLEGSRVAGIEVAGTARPLRGVSVEGSVTWMHARGLEEDGTTRRLAEKPAWLSTLTATYHPPGGLSLLLQTVYTGRAYSPDEANVFRPLPTSLVLNARAGYRLFVRQPEVAAEVFARVRNLADDTPLPQLGLPGPGRSWQLGVNVSF